MSIIIFKKIFEIFFLIKKFFYFIIFFFFNRIAESERSNSVSEKDRILQEKEAELRRMQELVAVMQAQMQQQQP